jgi:hypothetical protein
LLQIIDQTAAKIKKEIDNGNDNVYYILLIITGTVTYSYLSYNILINSLFNNIYFLLLFFFQIIDGVVTGIYFNLNIECLIIKL